MSLFVAGHDMRGKFKMDEIDVNVVISEELGIFKASANRMRWFISTAILISVLMLLHVYLEQFSFQDSQLESNFSHRIQNYTMEKQKCYEELAQYRQRKSDNLYKESLDYLPDSIKKLCSPPALPQKDSVHILNLSKEDLINEYSKRKFNITRTDNTMNEVKLQIRQIPLLGVEVPANDFVIVMAMMSIVFVIGVWVNLRSLKMSLISLAAHNNATLLRLAHLNTVFLTTPEKNRSDVVARGVRTTALWLPFFSILVSTVVSNKPLYDKILLENFSFHIGPMDLVVSQLVFSFILILVHLWVALECSFIVENIEKILNKKN